MPRVILVGHFNPHDFVVGHLDVHIEEFHTLVYLTSWADSLELRYLGRVHIRLRLCCSLASFFKALLHVAGRQEHLALLRSQL